MLFGTIVTLLIASIGISRIQAKAIGDQRAQLNNTQTSVNGGDSVNEALTVQNNNILNTGPNDESMYGSIVKLENNINESPDRRQPTSTETRTAIAPGTPGQDGVFNVKLEEHDHQGKPRNTRFVKTDASGNSLYGAPGNKNVFESFIETKNNVYKFKGSNNQTQLNEEDISSLHNVQTIATNNVVQTLGGNMKVYMGSTLIEDGNVYNLDKNLTTIRKTINNKEGQDVWNKLLKSIIKVSDSPYITIHESHLDSQIEKDAQDNKEKEAYAEKHSKPNGQTSLSSNVFYPFTYFLIILISVLN